MALRTSPTRRCRRELESIAKKHGFASFNEYDDVAATISNIMAGIDPATKVFSDPTVAIKKEMEEVKDDKRSRRTRRSRCWTTSTRR